MAENCLTETINRVFAFGVSIKCRGRLMVELRAAAHAARNCTPNKYYVL